MAILQVIGEITPYQCEGCFSMIDLEAFLAANPEGLIEMEITSPGGSVEQGLAIYDKLRSLGRPIKATAFQCDSIASIIFLAADERVISDNCRPLIHHPALMPWDLEGRLTSNELDEIASYLKAYEDQMMAIYVDRLPIAENQVEMFREKMLNEWTMSADEAVLWGLAKTKLSYANKATARKPVAYSDRITRLIQSKNSDMDIKKELQSFRDEIKALLVGKPKAFNIATTSETVAILYGDGDQIAVGSAVFSDEAMTMLVAAGTYETVDGQNITVDENGIVTAIDEGGMDAMKTRMSEMEAENTALKTQCEALKAEAKAMKDKADEYASKLSQLDEKVSKAFEMAQKAAASASTSPEAKAREIKKQQIFGVKLS